MQKVIVIAGPTGVGKTALSIRLAKAFQGNVISGDSMQVYQEMAIGTAKITPQEMDGIPHYLVDCYSYKEEYNVKVFQEKARQYMKQMETEHTLPIICGGTGLYIKSVLYDYEFIEQQKDEEFLSFLQSLSDAQLWAILKHVDANATETIHPHNRQRMVRAISMAHDGTKKSEVIAKQEHKMLYDVYCIGLTMNRTHLYERINQRVDQMMEAGLFEEVERLVDSDHVWDLQSMKSIGYKEWKAYFDGSMSKEQCVEAIKKNSRNFAKRQYTWFHNQMPMHWYDIEDEHWYETLEEDIKQWMKVIE